MLIEGWNDASAATRAYNKVFAGVGIDPQKCLHIRTSTIERASSIGELSPEIIATMTKQPRRSEALGRQRQRVRVAFVRA
jgi:hypothetical protein